MEWEKHTHTITAGTTNMSEQRRGGRRSRGRGHVETVVERRRDGGGAELRLVGDYIPAV